MLPLSFSLPAIVQAVIIQNQKRKRLHSNQCNRSSALTHERARSTERRSWLVERAKRVPQMIRGVNT